MTPESWKQVEALFEECLEIREPDRAQFLAAIKDLDLRREVESLLSSHIESGSFLEEADRFFSREGVDGFLPDEVIDRYRIIREIGRGGMGAVFLAERADDQYQKKVALKLIKRGMDTDSVLRHFRNERQILAGFDHPNIARLLDGGTTATGLPYFVMEFVEGLPIDDYCNTYGLSVPARLELFREVCAAVSYAHRHLVIHRDIKRSNILITPEGVPKLLDFGIAKMLGEDGAPLLTMTGQRLMTPEYASPEQARGERVTTASDVYSLGVVLYELLTGQSPYGLTNSRTNDFAKIITETQPRKPSMAVALADKLQSAVRNPKLLKGDLDNIVLMALRKEPERRYQSADQFSEDIRRHLEELPVQARNDTAGYRASKFVRRNKTALVAATLVLLALIGGIIATSRQAQIARREKARAERQFNDVRTLANRVLFDYHDAIKALPGATKVREMLVKDAFTYLDALAVEAHGDRALERELAAAYEKVGDVRSTLGDMAGVLESQMKAMRIREALVTADPTDLQARRGLASSYKKVGNRIGATGNVGSGVEYLRKALSLFLTLARDYPADIDLQSELAATRLDLASDLSGINDFAEALEQGRAALTAFDQLAASHPLVPAYRYKLWWSHMTVAVMLSLANDTANALVINEKALALGEALLAQDPLNADYRRSLVINYQNGGDILQKIDKPGALESLRRAVALGEELVAADPANGMARKDLAFNHKRVADLLVELKYYPEALQHFREAVEGYAPVIRDAPEDMSARFCAAASRAGVARMQACLGETEPALSECGKVITWLRETTGDQPGHLGKAEAHEYLGHAYLALAALPQASADANRERTGTAREMFRESQRIIDEARRRDGDLGTNETWAKEIAAEIAKCDAALAK